MKWKILILVVAISLIAGCIGEKPGIDTGKVNDTKDGSKVSTNVIIDSIVFTRTGTQVNLKEEAQVTSANVYDNDTKIASQNVNSKAKDVLIDFNWEPKKQYKLEVQTESGATSSSVYAPMKSTAIKLGEITLEDVNPGDIDVIIDNIRGEIAYSPDGKYLVVGTHTGIIKAIETSTNKLIFEKKLSEGRISSFEFSSDSKYLFLGEQSMDGYVYTLELSTGKEIWKFRTADEIGTGSGYSNYPSVGRVKVVGNTGYAVAVRSASGTDKTYYWTRIYAFDIESGRVLWKYPENETMDIGDYWLDVSPNGKYIWVGGYEPNKGNIRPTTKYKNGAAYILNNEGKVLWIYEFPVLPYQVYPRISKGSFSEDGKYVAIIDNWGAAYFFDNEEIIKSGKASPLWTNNLSTAIKISDVPIYAGVSYVKIIGDNVIFATAATYIPSMSKSAKYSIAPVEHPNSNTVFVNDLKGNLIWKWKVEGMAWGNRVLDLSKDGRFLVFAVAQNLVTNNLDIHGLYVFDNAIQGGATSKLRYIYKTKGIVMGVAISPDGRYIAAVESPVRLEDGTVLGEYKVHILS